MIYLLPTDPTIPIRSLRQLRAQAKRSGYLIGRDRYSNTYSLVDARLRVPLSGFDHIGLAEIANAIEEIHE